MMKIWLIVVIVTLTVFISVIQCDSNEDGSSVSSESQEASTNLINTTSAELHYLNGNYINEETYEADFKRKNSTYTNMPLEWDVLKDFPNDTVLITKLVRSKSKDGPWEDVQTYVSKICNLNDKYHNYLPPFLIELTKEGKCVQKGKYHFDDAGVFQFYRLIPARSLKGWYFITYNKIGAFNPKVLIKDVEFRSKSIYAK